MSSFDQQAVEAFVLTEKLGSISAAAKSMGKNRAQLSQWIANLEIDWNVELFSRTGHKPSLTEAGRRLLPMCQQLLEQQQLIAKQVALVGDSEQIHLRLGVSVYLASSEIALVVSRFHAAFPNVDLEIVQRRDEQLLNWDQDLELDLTLCIYRDQYPANAIVTPITKINIVAVCYKNHPLANACATNTEQVLAHTWITLRSHSKVPLWEPEFIQRQIQVEEQALAIELCKSGLGVLSAEQSQVQPYLDSGELLIIDHEQATITESLGVVVAKTKTKSEQLNQLIKIIQSVFPSS
ncbi:LysR family transcriptional regulator [Alginatibacterium sediminis]|uniref:LysR family transcriptional regulator n=1 Tax=Alginatibacterium sediminis TaxID=2164068 RepID=UPI00131487F1|nr:LysR family transcriptional regulator [Alginatibacterium sediminis]